MGNVIYLKTREKNYMPVSIFEVARYFLSLSSMNHKKLQKLCYYAQAWHLALGRGELMHTCFEAWVHGPVSPELYSRYQEWKGLSIPQCSYSGDLSKEQKDFLDTIYYLYGKYSGDQLELFTHKENPWKNARETQSGNSKHVNEISNEDMENYYKEFLH